MTSTERHRDQWNRTEDTKTHQSNHSHLIVNKAKNNSLVDKQRWENWISRRIKLDPYLFAVYKH